MSNNPQNNSGDPQGLPPFIPGLLIVSLLIVMSVLVAWRNYLRRNRMHTHVDALGTEWPVRWDEEAFGGNGLPRGSGRGRKLEKPEIYEIDVSPNPNRDKDPMTMKGLRWDDIAPLSITSLDPDLSINAIQGFIGPSASQAESIPASSYLNSRSASSLRFQLPRLPFFSSRGRSQTQTQTQPPDVTSSPPPPLPPADNVDYGSSFPSKPTSFQPNLTTPNSKPKPSDLQVSVMISMPDPNSRVYYPYNNDNDNHDSHDDDDHHHYRYTSEKAPVHVSDYEGGVPNVAFGIAIVPFIPTDREFPPMNMNDKKK